MNKLSIKRSFIAVLFTVLIAVTALFGTACSGTASASSDSVSSAVTQAGPAVLGEGAVSFNFSVTDPEGKETTFEIHTDKKTVGEALLEQKLISGTEGEFGLYVTEVNGTTLDFDKDGKYWALYVNGEYAETGVDSTDIVDGASYAFKAE